MAQTTAEAVPAQETPARGSRKRMAILLGSLLASGTGAAGAWFYLDKHPPEAPAPASEKKATGTFLPLEIFTVNLADREHYLQLGLTYEMHNAEAADSLKMQLPVLRSRILILLSSKTANELASIEGKKELTRELIAFARESSTVGHDSKEKGVNDVHFSAFVIQ